MWYTAIAVISDPVRCRCGGVSVGDVVPVREARYLGILSGYRIGTATGKA